MGPKGILRAQGSSWSQEQEVNNFPSECSARLEPQLGLGLPEIGHSGGCGPGDDL